MDKTARFRDLHRPGKPLLLPNPWDVGSAKILASSGFQALATTSSGFAATLGRPDGALTREEALAHAADLVAATELPVSADLENGFADEPEGVWETVHGAFAAGLAGCSIEDYTGDPDSPFYELPAAAERITAAVEAARGRLLVTARAENHIRGRKDLDDTIERLQAFQEAGADVLFAPGLKDLEDIRRVVREVDRPVNFLMRPGGPTVPELAEAGVARISVGGAFAYVALGAAVEAARELLQDGTCSFWPTAGTGLKAAGAAFA